MKPSSDKPPPKKRLIRAKRLPTHGLPEDASSLFDGLRLTSAEAGQTLARMAQTEGALPWMREPLNILALSGGAAGGAWGAGLLTGLSRAARLPKFGLVTGVSTGALIAPLIFAERDDLLEDAYTGGHASRLMTLAQITPPGAGAGLFRKEALDALIHPFVDEALLTVIAAHHQQGRRLLVSTTDLDRQQACIWDMGAIAVRAQEGEGERWLDLFRTVLAASASLPGLFAPRLIDCEIGGERFQEMHVDGGLAAPLFLLPEDLLRRRDIGRRLRGGRVYAIVNTVLDAQPKTTTDMVPAILRRSFDTMLLFSYRQAVSVTAAFCAGAGLPLNVSSIPTGLGAVNLLNFETPAMRALFDAAAKVGAGEDAWTAVMAQPDPIADLLAMVGKSQGRAEP